MTDNMEVYTERYVAFIDILGFSEHVRASANTPSEAKKILEVMNNQLTTWSNPAFIRTHTTLGEDFHHQSFSDCIVFSEAASPKGLHYLLFSVTQLALDLLANGFLSRGGIAKGLLHHSKNAVFGPAFLTAYGLEQNVAKYPRIVVDQATHKDFENNSFLPDWADKFMQPALAYASDGPVFVDTFSAFRFPDPALPEPVEAYRKQCRDNIQSKLDASIYDPKHYEKLQWLMTVWNTTVEHDSQRRQWIVTPAHRDFEKRNSDR
jgi:hypothetical protein